eukprot:CAMPEP_0194483516 /NCGR_PEP_ID=MMETSP0253-20130528/5092_1 /TAXON_ID=2966 /ORGANISM="Noctiluca scintillans" /LENGTH=92 /DNA_ID=CAMNT_0039323183 /DNA_START=61 /DNA_END=339 /DNA_ORIENTATION=-
MTVGQLQVVFDNSAEAGKVALEESRDSKVAMFVGSCDHTPPFKKVRRGALYPGTDAYTDAVAVSLSAVCVEEPDRESDSDSGSDSDAADSDE